MRLERKDWVIGIVIAALLAAVAVFQENTYLANSTIAVLGCIISYIILNHGGIVRAVRTLTVTLVWILIGSVGYYISNVNFEK
jgi:hypothetical protein